MKKTERIFILILCSVFILITGCLAYKQLADPQILSQENIETQVDQLTQNTKFKYQEKKTSLENNQLFDYQKITKLLTEQFSLEYIHHSPNFTYLQANVDDFLASFSESEKKAIGISLLEIAKLAIENLMSFEHASLTNDGKSLFIRFPNYEFELAFTQISPRLCIVMDDMGENPKDLEKLLALTYPVTVSIIPSTAFAKDVAKNAFKHGLEVFLHQPMQALDFKNQHELRIESSQTEIYQILTQNIDKLSYVTGINNHTGSKFTSNPQAVSNFVAVINENYEELIILDSLTYGKSVLYKESKKQDLQAYVRDIFLDNVLDIPLIIQELDKSAKLALKNGLAIAICHPHKQTLAALQKWQAPNNLRIVQLWQLRYINEN